MPASAHDSAAGNKISFVIPAYNEEAIICECLASVEKAIADYKAQEKGSICETEIIVVNNASTDRTKALVTESFPNVRIIDEFRKGLVWARKAGFGASTGNLIANLDADVLLPPEWLPKVVEEFANDPKLFALSGPFIYYDAPWHIRASTKIFYALGLIVDRLSCLMFKSGSLLQGGNFVFRREAIEKIGGFDTSIEFYGEDTDIGRRIGKVGKVKWTFDLPILSSGRRFSKQGMFMTAVNYAINFLSVTFTGKPVTKKHVDVREPSKS